MSQQAKVLDHGHVILINHMGSDADIVRSARVSYNEDDKTGKDPVGDAKLVRYLWKNKHTSPFEAVKFTFDIKCPIFVARQWHRHRTWAYNELSGRYRELSEEFYVPEPHIIGKQSKKSKQARDINLDLTPQELGLAKASCDLIRLQCEEAFRAYRTLLADGVPKELARSVLPVTTYTHYLATVDLHNLFHFINLRLHPHAQYEIQQYGQALLDIITPIVPDAVGAFIEARAEDAKKEELYLEYKRSLTAA